MATVQAATGTSAALALMTTARPSYPMLKHVAIGCLIGAWIAALIIGAGHLAGFAWPIAWAMAGFLAFFALGKGLMGVDKLVALRGVARGGVDPRKEFANPLLFWVFVFFKLLTWAVGWAVGAYLATHPGAFARRGADGLVQADRHGASTMVQGLTQNDRRG